jgi:hypothetical protein
MEHPDVLKNLGQRIAAELPVLGKTLVFCATIRAADTLVDVLLKEQGVGRGKVTLVHSRMEDPELADFDEEYSREHTRKELQIDEFLNRGDQPCVMVNVGMLTTGFDDPKIRAIVLARLTFSKNLFWQMIGRGTRGPLAGKEGGTSDCYVVDPIRLTDKFEMFDGYRPTIDRAGIPEKDLDHPDDFVDPKELAPSIRNVPPPPRPDTPMDIVIRSNVQSALRAFLDGQSFDLNTINEALEEVLVQTDAKGQRIVPATGSPAEQQASALAIIQAHKEAIEKRMGTPMPWLDILIPGVLNEPARKSVLRKLQVVAEQGIKTLEEWYEYEATHL